jgi:hypothetical protein
MWKNRIVTISIIPRFRVFAFEGQSTRIFYAQAARHNNKLKYTIFAEISRQSEELILDPLFFPEALNPKQDKWMPNESSQSIIEKVRFEKTKPISKGAK